MGAQDWDGSRSLVQDAIHVTAISFSHDGPTSEMTVQPWNGHACRHDRCRHV